MTEHGSRTGAPRDVPPPRPVGTAAGEPVEGQVVGADSGLGAAARALADAVAGLLGRDGSSSAGSGPSRSAAGSRAATGVLADVVAAVSAAARSARDPGGSTGTAPGSRDGGTARGDESGPASGGLLGDLLDTAAPRLPIRDRERLRRAYPGASDAEIADALEARAARLTGGIGAAVGGLAAAQWLAPPSLVAIPLELGAQTVLIAAVEVVLVGELHELAGRPAPGDARERAGAYLTSWTTQRPVGARAGGMFSAISSIGTSALRRRVARRLARSTTSMAPLLVGAPRPAGVNRKATAQLAERLRRALGIGPGIRPGGLRFCPPFARPARAAVDAASLAAVPVPHTDPA